MTPLEARRAPVDIRFTMRRPLARGLRAALFLPLLAASLAQAQSWNDPRSRDLAARATARRAEQLADSGLVDYTAHARGYLTFLAQFGEGFGLPPKVVKADELALEVYWRAPNVSKQWIVGRRDTLVLPTDIQYHRDHLGIVQNNFPDIIRLGDGDEVRDVPHPLSRPGLAAYDFAITDSLRFEIPGRVIDVYEVKVRPRDDQAAAAIGALYISKDDAQVVRMAFSFTRSALRDKQLDDVSIILENSLIQERFWLPRRQEIEIRRSGSWMDFPARGIIRGRWEIRDYAVNTGSTVALQPGPEIALAPPGRRAAHTFPPTPILDSLPADVTFATMDDVRLVQEEARRLVRAQALARARQTLPSARSFSEFLQVNRAEGLTIGSGLTRRFGGGVDARVSLRYGIADHEPKGGISLGIERASGLGLRGRIYREYRDAGDDPETSRLRNSLAAQEFGADYTQPFDARGGALTFFRRPPTGGWRWALEAAIEDQDSVVVAARPASGRYEPTLPALPGRSRQLRLEVEHPPVAWPGGFEGRFRAQLRVGRFAGDGTPPPDRTDFLRFFASTELQRPFGQQRLVTRFTAGFAEGNEVPPEQDLLRAGGPVTGPGYAFHQFSGDQIATARIEWQTPMPFLSFPLGRWGKTPARATLAPFAGAVFVSPAAGAATGHGAYPYAGLGTLLFFDLIRFDVARGLRDGRWRFGVDVVRDFWSIL
jgi:hypothetical protein